MQTGRDLPCTRIAESEPLHRPPCRRLGCQDTGSVQHLADRLGAACDPLRGQAPLVIAHTQAAFIAAAPGPYNAQRTSVPPCVRATGRRHITRRYPLLQSRCVPTVIKAIGRARLRLLQTQAGRLTGSCDTRCVQIPCRGVRDFPRCQRFHSSRDEAGLVTPVAELAT